MKSQPFLKAAFLGLAAILPNTSSWAASTVIDQYTDAFSLAVNRPSPTTATDNGTGLGGVVGGARNVTLSDTSSFAGTDANAGGNPARLTFDTGLAPTGTPTARLALDYGSFVSTSFSLNLNLTSSDSFRTTLLINDFTGSTNAETYTVTVRSGAGTANDLTRSVTLTLANGTVNDPNLNFPFSAFTGINFADVDGIQTVIQVTVGAPDTAFSAFSAVPEPGTLALLLPLAAGAVFLRRRKAA